MELFIGIDVSKTCLDIYIDGLDKTFKISNTQKDIEDWLKTFKSLKADHTLKLIVCEPTGGYETLFVQFMHDQLLPIHVVHANKVRHFAKTIGRLAKTDTMDARLLSQYAKVFQPQPDQQKRTPDQIEMTFLVKRRQQLLKQRIEESNRLDKTIPGWLKESIQNHLSFLKTEIDKIEKQIQTLSQSSLKESIDLLTSIPGVGLLTASTMLAGIPELGMGTSSSLASLIGIAPFNQDSGKFCKKRRIYAGRASVRSALYMATIASLIHNKQLKTFYQRLKAKGKPSKVAIVACMRKLLSILNAVFKRKSPWTNSLNDTYLPLST